MNEFDIKAAGWDSNPMHFERSAAIAREIISTIPVNVQMTALEYGAGTGIISFLLKDHLKEITMLDNSAEMVRIMNEKIRKSRASNLNALLFDLENDKWTSPKFDLLITQMVLHHVIDIKNITCIFSDILNPGGYLAIADLYPEDGSFHGEGFKGHRGFDPNELSEIISRVGFINITSRKCYVINKEVTETDTKQFDVFLLVAKKQ